jgi:hypothetical protein
VRGPHNIWRIVRTGATLERTGAMRTVLEAFDAPPQVRLIARILGWPFKPFGLKGDPALPPVTRALTALGPAYIKFGQILSTRPDVVGDDLARQLRVLQDKLPPFPTATAKKVFAREIGRDPDAVFAAFSEPVAAASIAQVHKAVIAESGKPVAVKVLRPGIARAFRKDIDAFYFGAWLLQTAGAGVAAAAACGCGGAFRQRGDGRTGPAAGGVGSGRVRVEHRQGHGLSGAGRGLAAVGPRGDDARLGRGAADGRPRGDRRGRPMTPPRSATGCCSCSCAMRCATGISMPTCIRAT